MTEVWHGPAGWEDPAPRRYGPVNRVAVVSDVHANVAALTAVLADIEAAEVERARQRRAGRTGDLRRPAHG